MNKAALVGALSLVGISLAGCNLSTILPALQATATADLLKANVAIAKASPTVGAFITAHVAQADAYFQQIAATGVLSPTAIAAEQAAVSKLNAYAANTPTTVSGVAQDIASAFTAIQNLTTVPGS